MDGFFLVLLNCPVYQTDSLQFHDGSQSWSVQPWMVQSAGLLLQILCRRCERVGFSFVMYAFSFATVIGWITVVSIIGILEFSLSLLPFPLLCLFPNMSGRRDPDFRWPYGLPARATFSKRFGFDATSLVTALFASFSSKTQKVSSSLVAMNPSSPSSSSTRKSSLHLHTPLALGCRRY